MAKEPMEGDLMERVPRRRDKTLVSNTLLFFSYGYGGLIQSLGCFLAYLVVFWTHNIPIKDLWMSSLDYWKEGAQDFCPTNGRECLTAEEQLYLQRQACSAWQMGIVFGQVSTLGFDPTSPTLFFLVLYDSRGSNQTAINFHSRHFPELAIYRSHGSRNYPCLYYDLRSWYQQILWWRSDFHLLVSLLL